MTTPKTDIWPFQTGLSRRLMAWAGLSISAGVVLILQGAPFAQGFGVQSILWGIIDAALAFFGMRSARRKANEPDAHTPERQAQERANLRRLLWINTGLDVLYVTGGTLLAGTKGLTDAFWRGNGWSIVVQGGFLFFFDLIQALLLKEKE